MGDGIRRVSCDAAFEGGDSLVMWLWEGWHIRDIFVCKLDSKKTVDTVKSDAGRMAQEKNASPMTLTDSDKYSKAFSRMQSHSTTKKRGREIQIHLCEFKITSGISVRTKIINWEISIEPTLLERKFSGKGLRKFP